MIASAGDFDCGSDIVPVLDSELPCAFELAGTEELCGWAELGTHDSGVLPTPAAQVACAPVAKEQTSLVEASVTAIATAALASTGVSVEQIVEPFTMVGPCLENSLESVRRFQRWWDAAVAETDKLRAADDGVTAVTPSDIQEQIDAIAAQEPVDAERLGPSILVDAFATDEQPARQSDTRAMAIDMIVGCSPIIANLSEEEVPEPGIELAAMDMLVGSSPIIATLDEENYLPYDLPARDIKLWSVFPLATQPFCVRSHVEEMDALPMWQEFDEMVVSENDTEQNESYVCNASADCLLDELIWRIETWTAEDSPLWATLAPRNIGKQVAGLISGGNRLFEGAAQMLASRWPEVEQSQTSAAGLALLTRAGAIEASDPIDMIGPVRPLESGEVQIVEAPRGRHRY